MVPEPEARPDRRSKPVNTFFEADPDPNTVWLRCGCDNCFKQREQALDKLRQSTKTVPRYLFRTFSSASGGGQNGLNSIKAIRPHAFLNGNPKTSLENRRSHISHFKRMVTGHLQGKLDPPSEVSSWAASMPLVLSYAYRKMHEYKEEGVYICVLDRNRLKNVSIYHAMELKEAGLIDHRDLRGWAWEYLVHGVVKDSAFVAVSGKELERLELFGEKGVPQLLNWSPPGDSFFWWRGRSTADILGRKTPTPIETPNARVLVDIAMMFGREFALVVVAAFITIARRRRDRILNMRYLHKNTTDIFYKLDDMSVFQTAVKDLGFPNGYDTDSAIDLKDSHKKYYPPIEQMVNILCCLLVYRNGDYPDLAPDGKTFTKRPIPVLKEGIDYETRPTRYSICNIKTDPTTYTFVQETCKPQNS